MPDIFDEVSEDLRADQASRFVRKYASLGVVAVIAILAATGAYVWWRDRAQAQADAVAAKFIAAGKAADARGGDRGPAAADLAAIAATGPSGYQVLAKLRLAALKWNTGDHTGAISLWQDVSGSGDAPKLLRDLATLLAVQHQIDTGDATALKTRLGTLDDPGNPWRPLARQSEALIDLHSGRQDDAKSILRELAGDPATPQGVRSMAGGLLQALGDAPPGPQG